MYFRTAVRITKRIDDSVKPDPVDNVWYSRHYKWPVYSFADAVKCHRETHHPTVYNSPDADLYVNLELDMRAVKAVIFLYFNALDLVYFFVMGGPGFVIVILVFSRSLYNMRS